ncbi:MAG: InlB B-repeat-containing protein [Clostridiales bacterium]|nr:InlB B-repeat-containing protein [Clostridiales bacterium]
MAKKFAYIVAIITISIISALLISCSNGTTNTTEPPYTTTDEKPYTVTYVAGDNGYVFESDDIIDYVRMRPRREYEKILTFTAEYSDYFEITAVPNEGYMFAGWSDGVTTATRGDLIIDDGINVTAEFKLITRTYTLNDRKAVASEIEENKETLTLTYGELDGVTLPVLQRDGFTFEGWYFEGQQIADSNGKLLIDDDFLVNEEKRAQSDKRREEDRNKDIRAKWQAEETFPFKILIVYVTRIQATLYDRNGIYHNVDFRMTDLQKRFCGESTKLLKKTMDDMCDGLVDFQIDEYYTTQTITTEHFNQQSNTTVPIATHLFPSDIPEVQDMRDEYDTVVSVFGFYGDKPTNEEADRFQHAAGVAWAGECSVFLDEFVRGVTIDHNTLEGTLNGRNQSAWLNKMEPFIHEIAHTIEIRLAEETYHSYTINNGTHWLDTNRLYYLRMLENEDGPVGIPYGFWKGEIANVFYDVSSDINGTQGYIVEGDNERRTMGGNHAIQEVVYGEDALGVKAVPFKGYRFVRWSDGVTTPERKDRNITGDFTVTAIFEPIVYTINVVAGEGGRVSTSSRSEEAQSAVTIEAMWGKRTAYVVAVADEGYRFVGWSDGTTNEYWSKIFYSSGLAVFDENNSYTLIAIFEKIN